MNFFPVFVFFCAVVTAVVVDVTTAAEEAAMIAVEEADAPLRRAVDALLLAVEDSALARPLPTVVEVAATVRTPTIVVTTAVTTADMTDVTIDATIDVTIAARTTTMDTEAAETSTTAATTEDSMIAVEMTAAMIDAMIDATTVTRRPIPRGRNLDLFFLSPNKPLATASVHLNLSYC